jgi:hypothetical protein
MPDQPRKHSPLFIDSRITFSFDPDTGLLTLEAEASWASPGQQDFRMPYGIYLTPETSRMLLEDLPKLEALLVRAKEGPTKPDFLQ